MNPTVRLPGPKGNTTRHFETRRSHSWHPTRPIVSGFASRTSAAQYEAAVEYDVNAPRSMSRVSNDRAACVLSRIVDGSRSERQSASESALAPREVAQCPKKIDLSEVRPEGLHEIELAVGALPQHEVAQSLLPRRADNQVGIRLAARVEVLADQFGRESLCEVLERAAVRVVSCHDAAHRVCDLRTPAVADGEINVKALLSCRAGLSGVQCRRERLGETQARPHLLHPPIA